MIGKTISHYRIVDKLGEGGMGSVWKAEDTTLHRLVAIKALSRQLAENEEARERFVREAQAASALNHANITTVYELLEDEGEQFIAMEYVKGETLKERIARGPLSLEETLDITRQIGEGLARAHREGIIHRDIKPSNVLLTTDGVAKIVDFGLAAISGAMKLTKTGTSMGTVAYSAPEQLRVDRIDHRADIWSLGIVLYEMITGRPPFEAEHEQGVVAQILQEEPQPVTALRARVPMELDRILTKALQKAPADRYQHLDDLLVDLKMLSETSQESRMRDSARPVGAGKRRTAIVTSLAVAVVAIVMIIFILTRGGHAGSVPLLAVLPPENLGQPADESLSLGLTAEMIATINKLEGIRAVPFGSVRELSGSEITDKEIRSDFKAEYTLRSSIQWFRGEDAGISIRMIPSLTRTSDGAPIWTDTRNMVLTDLNLLQTEIVTEIVQRIGDELLDSDQTLLAQVYSHNEEALQFYLRGMEYRERFRDTTTFQNAIACFDSAVTLDPSFVLAWTQLAETRAHRSYVFGISSDIPEALRAIERATALAPELPEVLRAKGYYHYYCLGDYVSANSAFEQYLERRPNDSLTYALLGYVGRRAGDWDGALVSLSKAIRLNPSDHSVKYNMAVTNLYLHRFREAQHYLDRALQISPEQDTYQRFNAFNILLRSGDVSRAEALYSEYFGQDAPWIIEQAGQPRHRQIARIFPAIVSHQLMMRQRENSYHWFLMHAMAERELGRLEPAVALYDSAYAVIETDINSETIQDQMFSIWQLSSLGFIHAGLGHMEEATGIANRLLVYYSVGVNELDNWEPLYNAAEIYMYIGDSEAALNQLEEVLKIPSLVSTSLLAADPLWNPVRDHPRFRALLREYK